MGTETREIDTTRLAIDAIEVSRLLCISSRHVSNLNKTGRMPRPLKLGRSARWDLRELCDWLAAGAPSRDEWEAMRDQDVAE